MFLGFVQLGGTLAVPHVTRNATTAVPTNADSAPGIRFYGAAGLMTNGTGTMSFKETGSITDATNASPIVITSINHGLSTDQRVSITGVGTNTAANGDWNIIRVNANTFSLTGSIGNGVYSTGGTWNVAGLYTYSLTASGANGYESGKTYFALVSFLVATTAQAEADSFTVV